MCVKPVSVVASCFFIIVRLLRPLVFVQSGVNGGVSYLLVSTEVFRGSYFEMCIQQQAWTRRTTYVRVCNVKPACVFP